MPTTTTLPLCDALGTALKSILLRSAVPAINADIAALMGAQNVPSGKQPTLSADVVRTGDIDAVSEPTICIIAGQQARHEAVAEGAWQSYFYSLIVFKVPAVGDNAPEDFTLYGNSFKDNVRDVLMSPNNFNIVPLNSADQNILPAGLTFDQCMPTREIGPLLVKPTNGTPTYRKWEITHYCQITYHLDRTQPLG